ncbi:MAG: hypothetical protein ACHQ50_01630 [Fimbriimonadales bacterium]
MGRAVSADGHRAYFTFDATKVTHNDQSSVHGTFDFQVPGATASDSIRVHLDPVLGMSVAENVATFGGYGILRVQHGSDLHYYHGRVYVIATSNRHPGEPGNPDTIQVHFIPATSTDPTFDFLGSVTDGDIAVTTTLSY